ncbi:hypothetical protein [Cohnella soli]|uniref:Family 2 glycosyl transferase n=1 Tax=Cohnella soli TaxID=425005 RepID=A0ABW0HY43_9BACL
MIRRFRIKWLLGLILFLAVLSVPLIVWQLQSSEVLRVAILDKTVPDNTYREHKGLTWLLNYYKYVHPDKTAYSVKDDYFGYVPGESDANSVRELDTKDDYDLLYVTDTYGVYKNDLTGNVVEGNRSDKIYGGLQKDDIKQIKNAIYKGTTLIAEFNTFGSPTEADVREEMYGLLGLRWSGWIGRYFADLSEGGEVPKWAIDNYNNQTGEKWAFKGAGFLFVNDKDYVAVLEDGKDTRSRGSEFVLTDKGKAFVGKSVRTRYNYWFDVIEAGEGNEVLANYELNLTEAGTRKLQQLGIPSTFPAVTRNDAQMYSSYYFAGDFADNKEVSGFHQAAWLDRVYSVLARDSGGSQEKFYWKAYRPLMKRIFQEISEKKKHPESKQVSPETATIEGMSIPAKTGGQYLQVYKNGKWSDMLMKGVNIGIGKPGSFPGEAAITKAEYSRWFKAIGEMNSNTIRVFTLHPPAFYEALLEYNRKAASPIYLLQGVWVDEEKLVASGDAYNEEIMKEYFHDIRLMVDVIHGKADIPANPGHASGAYRADISAYVLGWLLGIEWNPEMVVSTDDKHKGMADYDGRYFKTEKATPFESWLARTMDETASYEADKYQWQRPMSFINWVTTDLLKHPSEPLEEEDLVSIDPNVIHAKPEYKAGYFASYNVYPYYPDFLNYETKYTEYVDHRGERNSYAGYLHDLKKAHNMPVFIAEFGVPESRGMTHRNVSGWNQGEHNEQEQGDIEAHLFEDIYKEGMAGGLVFAWQDEWFKRSWNTMDLDDPDRRPFWPNVQVSEQFFGMLAFDPGTPDSALYPDGDAADWERVKQSPMPLKGASVQPGAGSKPAAEIKQAFVSSDERSLMFRIDFGPNALPLDWSSTGAMILLDTIPNQGQHRIPGGSGLTTDAGIDFAIDLRGPGKSRIWVDSYYDSTYYMYGSQLNMMPKLDYANVKDNGIFNQMRLVLNKGMDVPNVHGQTLHLPLDTYETGQLRFGNGNPDSPDFDSLTDVAYDKQSGVVEVRIPWQLLNVKDPSTREIMSDLWKKGLEGSESTDGFKIALVTYRSDGQAGTDMPGSKDIGYAMPGLSGNTLRSEDMYTYRWDKWDVPTYHERLKKSYYIMQKVFGQFGRLND